MISKFLYKGMEKEKDYPAEGCVTISHPGQTP